jgi:hypothetical protein
MTKRTRSEVQGGDSQEIESQGAERVSGINPEREFSRLHYLFDNDHPDQVWANASELIRDMSPQYDFSRLIRIFSDVADMFYGDYSGYQKVLTPYHDLRHTMDVTMCALRLMHGMYVAGEPLSDDDITIVACSALTHDIGYAKELGDEEGTGAKYTKTHVNRGIQFMRGYIEEKHWPAEWMPLIESSLLCTNPALVFSEIEFADDHARKLGVLVGTADLVGQMADRSYLEKLLFLYFEFKEADMGDFKSTSDLLRRTNEFYQITRKKLDNEFECTYRFLDAHFRNWFGVNHNYYMDSIEKNIAYLQKVIQGFDEGDYLKNLKRRGIVEKAKTFSSLPIDPE